MFKIKCFLFSHGLSNKGRTHLSSHYTTYLENFQSHEKIHSHFPVSLVFKWCPHFQIKEKMFAQRMMVDIDSSDNDASLCTSQVFFSILGGVSEREEVRTSNQRQAYRFYLHPILLKHFSFLPYRMGAASCWFHHL